MGIGDPCCTLDDLRFEGPAARSSDSKVEHSSLDFDPI